MKAKIKFLTACMAFVYASAFSQDRSVMLDDGDGPMIWHTMNGEQFGMAVPTEMKCGWLLSGCYTCAIPVYRQMIADNKNDFEAVDCLAACYAMLRKNDSAFYFLEKYLLSDEASRNKYHFFCDKYLLYITDDERYDKLVKKYQSKIEENEGKITNLKLAETWWIMQMNAESYRGGLSLSQMDEWFEDDNFVLPQHKLDSLNTIKLKTKLSKNGWPLKSVVGERASHAAFCVLMNTDLETMKKYLPMLQKAVENKEASKEDLCFLTDRILLLENKPQLYGTQFRYRKEDWKNVLCPIEDRDHVNDRRKAMGLNSLDDYLADFGLIEEN